MISLTDKRLLFASWKMGQQHFQTCCALNGSEENKKKRDDQGFLTKRNYYSSGSSEVLFVNSNQNEEY
jgi:hypothetical protein